MVGLPTANNCDFDSPKIGRGIKVFASAQAGSVGEGNGSAASASTFLSENYYGLIIVWSDAVLLGFPIVPFYFFLFCLVGCGFVRSVVATFMDWMCFPFSLLQPSQQPSLRPFVEELFCRLFCHTWFKHPPRPH